MKANYATFGGIISLALLFRAYLFWNELSRLHVPNIVSCDGRKGIPDSPPFNMKNKILRLLFNAGIYFEKQL
ncbi:hypothetical protein [Dyadobacter sp. Leaf189]|uniref:hypothetical protein n=1 Tax=Dyadobacter sp. Leaf189 TaxID=1736295 RepID=UPI0012F8565D|nr:hypothetical protein [Dyadobacter sp. Leaf189]